MSLLQTLLPAAFYGVSLIGVLAVWRAERSRSADTLHKVTALAESYKADYLQALRHLFKSRRKHQRCHDLYVESRKHIKDLQADHEDFLQGVYAEHDAKMMACGRHYLGVLGRKDRELAALVPALAATQSALADDRVRAHNAEVELATLKVEYTALNDIERPLWLKTNADLNLKVEQLEKDLAARADTVLEYRKAHDMMTARNQSQSATLTQQAAALDAMRLELQLMRENVKALSNGHRADGRRGHYCVSSDTVSVENVRYLALGVSTNQQRHTLVAALGAFFSHHVADPQGSFNGTEGLALVASLGGKLNRMIQVERKRQKTLKDDIVTAIQDDAARGIHP
ncbi:hypothetical protein HOT36_gp15 [Ralstonia phage RPSC1]|uniref:Uncharacterized protein n=1 Tax=Ralstonia phage RPSC1 TaxID=2041351 RepID=A0A2Z2UAP6_9CAUD|nr:hypothetical protein HOT36_gp15 [Ralstonia phage RPSC1]ATN92945.1 hypothetical protein RPSC1_14 [Ralstonia phage RPSC1]